MKILAPGAPPTARPSKCTILSDTRALSGPPVHHTTAEVPLMPLGHESVPGTLCIQNVLATAHQTAGATLAGAPPTARLSKCTILSVTRAWSGMTTVKVKPQHCSTHVLEHAQTHHGIPLHTKDARNSTSDSARNSRARHPARPSKCTIWSTVRARSGTPTPTTTETLHMRASNTLKGIVGFLCTQKVLATAAPARQRAQLSGARHGPLAHPNALSRALHGPGVAHPRTQLPQKRHARVLSTRRDASRDPFALKRCVCSKHAAPQNSWPSDQPLVHQNPSY